MGNIYMAKKKKRKKKADKRIIERSRKVDRESGFFNQKTQYSLNQKAQKLFMRYE